VPKRVVCKLILALLLVGAVSVPLMIRSSRTYTAAYTIYITSTGSVVPDTAPITQNGNKYTLYENITSNLLNTIVVQRNDIILDGAGFTVQGSMLTGSNGINLTQTNNVTIQNVAITSFHNGIFLKSSMNNHITEANISSNKYGIYLQSSNLNQITGNVLTQNTLAGIWLDISQNNNIVRNKLANTISSNYGGIVLHDLSNNNSILANNITSNRRYGIYVENCWLNRMYHNNFVDNFFEAYVDPLTSYANTWDNAYPSGGNYWSNYVGVDVKSGPYQNLTGSDGIGDTAYVIDSSNIDHYPLMNPSDQPEAELTFDPASVNKNPGDVGSTFTVDVKIADVTDLFGFDMNVTWDNTLITFLSFDNTPLNAVWPQGFFDLGPQAGAGYVRYAATALGGSGYTGVGPTTLFAVTFTIVKAGDLQLSTPIHFMLAKLSDSHANSISATLTDGLYSMSARSLHLLLTVDPNQATYVPNQPVTFEVSVLNQLNPSLDSTLTLTVTGPGNYYYFDFQLVNVKANAVGEYSFTWNVPNVGGTYIVEVSLVPAQLTAYDAVWLGVV